MIDVARALLEPLLNGSSRQVDVLDMLAEHRDVLPSSPEVLDLGAGDGTIARTLSRRLPNMEYRGLDIENSPEVSARKPSHLTFLTYDGIHMPFDDASFDLVFSKQVLEHVRHPDAVLAEVRRVLRPGGLFVGSCSQLEPYHSHSIFNWTAYGVVTVFADHGLRVRRLAPGVDGLTLMLRRLGDKKDYSPFFANEGLLNYFLEMTGNTRHPGDVGFRKLLTAGHLVWVAGVDEDPDCRQGEVSE